MLLWPKPAPHHIDEGASSLPCLCFLCSSWSQRELCKVWFWFIWMAARMMGEGGPSIKSPQDHPTLSLCVTLSHKYQSLHTHSPRWHLVCSHFLFGCTWLSKILHELLMVKNQAMNLNVQICNFSLEIRWPRNPGATFPPGLVSGLESRLSPLDRRRLIAGLPWALWAFEFAVFALGY